MVKMVCWTGIWVFCCASTMAQTVSQPACGLATQPASVIKGFVPDSACRPLCIDSKQACTPLLKHFASSAKGFSYKKQKVSDTLFATVWRITFPSPYMSPQTKNNTVWCEYYQSKVKGPRPAVIVLHHMDLGVSLMRNLCSRMSAAGIDSLWLEMAYYGERASAGASDHMMMTASPDLLKSAVCQTVMDVRRASEFLASQPNVEKKKIYLMGWSLGALMSALTIGVDGEFPKAVLVLGGGDIAKIIEVNPVVINVLRMMNGGNAPTLTELREQFRVIEPLTYVQRAKDTEVLMFNGRRDKVVPPECSKALARRLPKAHIEWFDGDHVGISANDVLPETIRFFKEDSPNKKYFKTTATTSGPVRKK